ncbi:MAG: hypothetical protein ACM3SY_09190 [Candidatus Omnitrophota bacterium]
MRKMFLVAAMLLLFFPLFVQAVVVGTNADVHFDYPGLKANDFHVEGYVYSAGGITPIITSSLIFGDPGTGTWVITSQNLTPVSSGVWKYTANYQTNGYIQYCQWIHFGVKFNVNYHNIFVNLKGWWTLNGVPLMQQSQNPPPDNYQQAPVTGFDVFTQDGVKKLKITNDTNMSVSIPTMQLAVSNMEIPLEDMFTTGLGRPGEPSPKYSSLIWKPVPNFPTVMLPKTYIVITLSDVGIELLPGQFLAMRGQQVMSGGVVLDAQNEKLKKDKKTPVLQTTTDWGWFWHQHGE